MLRAENPSGRRRDFATVAEYEASGFWFASKVRYWLSGLPWECFICGEVEIELHHLGYGRPGYERPDELVPLCSDHHRMVERLVKEFQQPRDTAHLTLAERLERRKVRQLHRPSFEQIAARFEEAA